MVLAHRADPDDPDAHRRRHKASKEGSGYKRAADPRLMSKASYSFVPSVALSGVTMAVDPVCVKPVNPHNAYWMIWYKGTPYYFDSEECQLKFDHKPEHYRQLALDRRQNEAVY
jgi:YHS domain-containing protein